MSFTLFSPYLRLFGNMKNTFRKGFEPLLGKKEELS